MDLYKKSKKKLTEKLFKNPTSEYRGAPFWAWNGKLSHEYLAEQIDVFKKMGFGGAHMHVRSGFGEEYLGEKHHATRKAALLGQPFLCMDCKARCFGEFAFTRT